MIETFKRFRLQQKGLSCGKKRREREQTCIREFFTSSPVMMGMLLAVFGLLLGWLVLYRPGLGVPHVDEPFKAILVMALLFMGAFLHFSITHPGCMEKNSRLLLVLSTLSLHLGLMKLVLIFVEDNLIAGHYRLLLIPYALAPMVLTLLMGRGQGIFAAVFTSLWGTLLLPETKTLPWLATSLCVGLVTVAASHGARKRQHILRAGLLAGLASFFLALLFDHLSSMRNFNGLSAASWRNLLGEGFVVVGVNLLTGIVISAVLPILESTFRLTTIGAWTELADLNHPLLRRMTIEAPGTYHHSLMVANLAEAAAEAIGANALMTRVCAYFHDIGKLKNPEYFIENQSPDNNPHDSMTPSMSALVVISHVKDGVDLALRHKLNREIVDVIEQHHGNSLVLYFYQRAVARRDELRALAAADKAHDTDVPEVEQSTFRYPGPKPQTREAAIISLADSVESASRTLAKPTPARIEQMVDSIVNSRILDGQLDECDLTLGQLETVKKSFTNSLRSMLHKRVSYEKEKAAEKSGGEDKTDAKPASDTTAQRPGAPRTTRFEVIRGTGGGKAGAA